MKMRIRGFAFGLLLAAALGGAAAPAQAEQVSRLFAVLASENGLALLRETAVGRELAEKLIGRAVVGAEDVKAIEARLGSADARTLRAELEARIPQIDAELRATERVRPLALAERTQLLDQISGRLIHIRFLSFPAAPMGGFAEQVEGFKGSFDAVFPVEKGSIEERLPVDLKVAERLKVFEKKFFSEHGIARPDQLADRIRQESGSDQVSLYQVIEALLKNRQLMASELHTMAELYRADEPFLASTLDQGASQIQVSAQSLRKFEAKGAGFKQIKYVNGQEYRDIGGYTGKVFGEMGELKITVRLAGVVGRSLTVGEVGRLFGEGPVAEAARRELGLLSREYPDYMQKELDLILEQGTEWAEVKNYHHVFSAESYTYERVIEQAQRTVRIKNLLEANPAIAAALKAMGKSIRLRIYFVSGLTENVARQLEAMGYRVFGERVAVGH